MKKMIKTYLFDLEEHGTVGTPDEELFERLLRKENLWNIDMLYRAAIMTPKKRELLKKYGVDHPKYDSIFALRHDEIFGARAGMGNPTLFEYADTEETRGIAIYDGNHLEKGAWYYGYDYYFKNPDKKLEALIALFHIRWERMNKNKVKWHPHP